MASEVVELISFCADARADVRAMAAEGIAGYTATADGTAALTQQVSRLYPALVQLIARAPAAPKECGPAAAMACAALVNLSQQPRERLRLLDEEVAGKGLVKATAACVALDEPLELAEYASMLLANLTQLAAGVDQLQQPGAAGESELLRTTLLPRLAGAPLTEAQGARLSHIALALTNVAQLPAGRASILKALADDGAGAASTTSGASAIDSSPLLRSLCAQLGASATAAAAEGGSHDPRRLAAARLLRNLCFAANPEAEQEEQGRSHLMPIHRQMIVYLVGRLAVHNAQYRDDEKAGFHPHLVASVGSEMLSGKDFGPWSGNKPAEGEEPKPRAPLEEDPEVRLALTEALLIMSASPEARATMRDLGIYPILRDAHLTEDVETCPASRHVRDANEQLVDLFYLSQEAVGATPESAEGAAEIEEVPD